MLSFRNTTVAAIAPNKRHAKKDLPSGRQAAVSTEARKFLQKTRLILIASIIVCLLTRTVQSASEVTDRLAGMSVQKYTDTELAEKEKFLTSVGGDRFKKQFVWLWYHNWSNPAGGNKKLIYRVEVQNNHDELTYKTVPGVKADNAQSGVLCKRGKMTIYTSLNKAEKQPKALYDVEFNIDHPADLDSESLTGTKWNHKNDADTAKNYPIYRIMWENLPIDYQIYYALSRATDIWGPGNDADITDTVMRLVEGLITDKSWAGKSWFKWDIRTNTEPSLPVKKQIATLSDWEAVRAMLDHIRERGFDVSKWHNKEDTSKSIQDYLEKLA